MAETFSFESLISLIAAVTGCDAHEIEPASEFYGALFFDGLDVEGILEEAEQHFGVSIPEGELKRLNPRRDLVGQDEPNPAFPEPTVQMLGDCIWRLQQAGTALHAEPT